MIFADLAAAAAFGMRLELSLNAMNTRAAGRSVHICLPRGGICHGDCGDRCVCTVSGWKVSSNLPGAIVRVWKGLGTRVGAHGARPGVEQLGTSVFCVRVWWKEKGILRENSLYQGTKVPSLLRTHEQKEEYQKQ